MVQQGKSIIFISHKLHEVTAVADRITVLRKGKVTAEGQPLADLTRADLARLMVGRDVVFTVHKKPHQLGSVVLEVNNIHAENDKGVPALRGVSLDIRSGEILGIAGVAGNGQRELAQIIAGMRACNGSVKINGQEVSNQPPITAIRHGVSYVPADRTRTGSSPNLSITDNTIMKNFRAQPIGNGWSINFTTAREHANNLKDKYDILAPSIDTMARKLSGGNLQKVILAREISAQPKLMVAVQPTRGLDVGAIEAIQKLLLEQREAGTAVLLISEELEELLALSDRLAVIFDGRIMGVVPTDEADINEIGLMMTGTTLETLRAKTGPEKAKPTKRGE
jgi:simple sugar transport system ATP-binding protein